MDFGGGGTFLLLFLLLLSHGLPSTTDPAVVKKLVKELAKKLVNGWLRTTTNKNSYLVKKLLVKGLVNGWLSIGATNNHA